MLIYTILGLLLFISLCVNYLQWKIIIAGLRREQKLKDSLLETQTLFSDCLDDMRNIDNQKLFESDDEVGEVFTKLAEVLYKTDEKIKKYSL